MNQVPKEWTAMIAVLREAQVAQDAARLPNISDAARDEEIARYARACDALVANLGALSERQVLGRITMILAKKDRI